MMEDQKDGLYLKMLKLILILKNMTDDQIKVHKLMKSKFTNYPKLPKFILSRENIEYKKPNKGLTSSCLHGFYDRINNWYLQNQELI